MKQGPREKRVTERMAPGVLSREGFLGDDRRPYTEIVDADQAELERLGVSNETVAEELGKVHAAALGTLGTPVPYGDRLTVVFNEGMGRMPCPFGGCGTFQKGEVELADATTGERVVFTPLSVHLVREHGFYQGRGSRYRLEPAALVRLFSL